MAERKIVRLIATDIDGSLPLRRALRKVKGISFAFSKAVCMQSGIDSRKNIGLMDENEIRRVEETIKTFPMPPWLLNRRRDLESGADMHIIGANIELKKREDINMLKRIRSYRGVGHEFGLPVRGQRTRSSCRTQKTVGVVKKSFVAKKEPAAEKK